MDIKKLISEKKAEFNTNGINEALLHDSEKAVGVHFGKELTEYLTEYGYLAYGFVEFYGLNLKQGLKSDLVEQTLYLHKYYPETSTLVAIENQGEGDYYLVDSNDWVYEYDSEEKELCSKDVKLFEYIKKRFEAVG